MSELTKPENGQSLLLPQMFDTQAPLSEWAVMMSDEERKIIYRVFHEMVDSWDCKFCALIDPYANVLDDWSECAAGCFDGELSLKQKDDILFLIEEVSDCTDVELMSLMHHPGKYWRNMIDITSAWGIWDIPDTVQEAAVRIAKARSEL